MEPHARPERARDRGVVAHGSIEHGRRRGARVDRGAIVDVIGDPVRAEPRGGREIAVVFGRACLGVGAATLVCVVSALAHDSARGAEALAHQAGAVVVGVVRSCRPAHVRAISTDDRGELGAAVEHAGGVRDAREIETRQVHEGQARAALEHLARVVHLGRGHATHVEVAQLGAREEHHGQVSDVGEVPTGDVDARRRVVPEGARHVLGRGRVEGREVDARDGGHDGEGEVEALRARGVEVLHVLKARDRLELVKPDAQAARGDILETRIKRDRPNQVAHRSRVVACLVALLPPWRRGKVAAVPAVHGVRATEVVVNLLDVVFVDDAVTTANLRVTHQPCRHRGIAAEDHAVPDAVAVGIVHDAVEVLRHTILGIDRRVLRDTHGRGVAHALAAHWLGVPATEVVGGVGRGFLFGDGIGGPIGLGNLARPYA